MTVMISIRLSDEQVEALDHEVREGRQPTRGAVVRSLIDDLAAAERGRALQERFREAYATPPTKDVREMHELMDDAARLLLERMEWAAATRSPGGYGRLSSVARVGPSSS